IYSEESFGPVVCIVRVRGVDEAVRVANETEYGLSAAVFGRDVMRALAVARRIQSGMCHINGPTVHDEAQMPFGGAKASGYGRFGGRAVIDQFTELRWITIEDAKQPYPFRPPNLAKPRQRQRLGLGPRVRVHVQEESIDLEALVSSRRTFATAPPPRL